MNDREYERHKTAVGEAIKRWKDRLWLGHWTIHVVHSKHGLDQRGTPAGSTAAARCLADWRYLEATIDCDCPCMEEKETDVLDKLVLHEMLHVVVQEMREWEGGRDVGLPHEERVVTNLANVLEYAYTKRPIIPRSVRRKARNR